jgi:hypothetical protein
MTQQAAGPASSKRLLETPATALAVGAGEGHPAVAATKLRESSPLGSSATSSRRRRGNPHRERNCVTRLGTRVASGTGFRSERRGRLAGAAGQRPAAAANASVGTTRWFSTRRNGLRADSMERHHQLDTLLEISPAFLTG